MTKALMKKYARLIARVGANVQKGQGVMLYAETAQAPFAALVRRGLLQGRRQVGGGQLVLPAADQARLPLPEAGDPL